MKKILFSLLASLIIAGSLSASGKVIKNPSFDARKSSIPNIVEIDRGKDATRVKFRIVFRPRWWFVFNLQYTLADPVSGQVFKPLSGEGITFKEKITTPLSGDTTFTVIYPPIPKDIKSVDFAPGTSWVTYGVDLTGKKKSAPRKANPTHLSDTSPRRPVSSALASGNVRIHGRIEGYDERLDINDLKIYIGDFAASDRYNRLIEIDGEGNFDAEFFLPTAQTSYIGITQGVALEAYLEPGNDLELIIDWEDLLHIDRMRGLVKRMDNIRFGGSLGEINRDLYFAPQLSFPYSPYDLADRYSPLQARDMISEAVKPWKDRTLAYVDSLHLSPDSRRILENNLLCEEASRMLDYAMYRRDKRWEFPDSDVFKEPIPREFYDGFLPQFLSADTAIIHTGNMHFLLNRLAFSGLEQTLEANDSTVYMQEYGKTLPEAIRRYAGAESVPFLWQLAISGREANHIKGSARWYPDEFLEQKNRLFDNTISDPYLREVLDSIYTETVNVVPHEIPATEAGRLLKKLIAPYSGKWIVLDFWATSCAPCRQNIEWLQPFRDANRDNPDFTFLFVTGDDESPEEAYKQFVAKSLTNDNVLRLKQNDVSRLYQQFGINGIPHYMLIDPQGLIVDENFSAGHIRSFLNKENIEYVNPEGLGHVH